VPGADADPRDSIEVRADAVGPLWSPLRQPGAAWRRWVSAARGPVLWKLSPGAGECAAGASPGSANTPPVQTRRCRETRKP